MSEMRSRLISVGLACGVLIVAAAVLTFIAYLTAGLVYVVAGVGLVLGAIALVHYVVWGRWLAPLTRQQVEQEEV